MCISTAGKCANVLNFGGRGGAVTMGMHNGLVQLVQGGRGQGGGVLGRPERSRQEGLLSGLGEGPWGEEAGGRARKAEGRGKLGETELGGETRGRAWGYHFYITIT